MLQQLFAVWFQVWYCVPPASRKQFEQMAKSIMMGEYQKCKGFLRHKEVLISPSVLKQYHVDYKLVRKHKPVSNPERSFALM